MNIEDFREYCLSLPDVTEATPFEKFSMGKFTILVFYINSHMFCYFNVDDFSNITIKYDPTKMAEQKELYQAKVIETLSALKGQGLMLAIASSRSHALGYEASETLVVGDMNVDILMGVNAGAKTCGVTYGNGTKKELEEAGAEYIIDSIDELIGIVEKRELIN